MSRTPEQTIAMYNEVLKNKEIAIKELKAMVRERNKIIKELREENESLYERRY